MTEAREVYADGDVRIEVLADLGPYSNNAYLISSPRGGGVTVVDAPEGAEAVVEALAGRPVDRIVVTHSHFDHWGGYEVLRAHTDAPVLAGVEETELDPAREVQPLAHDEVLEVGDVPLYAVHTPGHTPGSMCLYVEFRDGGGAVFTGDTLFPGGPGRTPTPEACTTIVESITSRLHTLAGATLVLPGHGTATTIEHSTEEYAVFAGREHPADLCGDILWLKS